MLDIGGTEEFTGTARMPSTKKPRTLSDDEVAAATAAYLALKNFTELRPTMPLQYVMTFLQVCMEEGLGTMEYAQRAEVPPTVMTRHLLDIGDRNRAREEGFGLVTQERDRNDLRRHAARITPKGKALIHRFMLALKSGLK